MWKMQVVGKLTCSWSCY